MIPPRRPNLNLRPDQKKVRTEVIEKLGVMPESIMRVKKSDKPMDVHATERGFPREVQIRELAKESENSEYLKLSKRAKARHNGENGALSKFPQNIGRALTMLYTKRGDTVVDPFAGHNSRMEMCWRIGRNYIGQDICHSFVESNRKVAAALAEEATQDMFGAEHLTAWIDLHEGDSRKLQVADGVGDFTITSPPYWDIEYYGPEPEQLGNAGSYSAFLDRLHIVSVQNWRALKSGAFCVWFVNDFRRAGEFISFHEHTAAVLRKAGFVQWDTCIVDLGQPLRGYFAQQVIDTKILPKRHEYGLVFRKP